jgi:hypothetical protein
MVAEEPEAADTYNMNFEDAETGNYLVQDGNGLWMDQYDKGWSWVDADAETGNKYLVLSGAEGDATVDFWFNGVTAGSTVEFDFRMPSASAGWDRLAVALGSSDVNYSWRFEQWQGWTSVKYPDWDGNDQTVNEAFQIGAWYSVKMEWSGDGISVKLWQQGAEEPAQYTYITWNTAFAAGSDGRINFGGGDHFSVACFQIELEAGVGLTNDKFTHMYISCSAPDARCPVLGTMYKYYSPRVSNCQHFSQIAAKNNDKPPPSWYTVEK